MPLRKQGTIIPSVAAAIALGVAALPASASAFAFPGTTTASASSSSGTVLNAPTDGSAGCVAVPTSEAFSGFGDDNNYYLAPGGSFESGGPSWTLTGGAAITGGNESLGVASGSKALRLPFGGTATSPAFCVDQSQPSFRFTSKLSSLDGGYAAIVIYRDSAGKVVQSQFTSSADGTYYNGATNWNPSSVNPLATHIPLVQAGGIASVQLKFVGTTKAYGMFVASSATIDSVMVDPYRRG